MSKKRPTAKGLLKKTQAQIKENDLKGALLTSQEVLRINVGSKNKSQKEWQNKLKQNYQAYMYCGFVCTHLGEYEQARDNYDAAHKINPESMDIWKGLHELYQKSGDEQKLKQVLEKLVKMVDQSKSKWRTYALELADLEEKFDDLSQAKVLLEQIIALVDSKGSGPAASSKTVAAWTTLIRIEEKLGKIRFKNQLAAKIKEEQLRIARAKAKPVSSRRKRRGAEEKESLRIEAIDYETEKKLTEALNAEFLESSKLDDLYLRVISFEKNTDPQFHRKYIERLLTKMKAADEGEQVNERILSECKRMASKHASETFPLRAALQIVSVIDFTPEFCEEIGMYAQKLLKMDISCGAAYIALACKWIVQGVKRKEAEVFLRFALLREPLIQGEGAVNRVSNSDSDKMTHIYLAGWCWLACITGKTSNFKEAIDFVKQGLALVKSYPACDPIRDRAKKHLTLTLAEVFLGQGGTKHAKSESLFKEVLKTDSKNTRSLVGLCKLRLAQKNYRVVAEVCQHLINNDPRYYWAISLKGWVAYLDNNIERARKVVEEAVQVMETSGRDLGPDDAVHYCRLGLLYWNLGDEYRTVELCRNRFLRAVKLDGTYALPFAYLGHFYRLVDVNEERSKRCYTKAIALDPVCEEAGIHLGELYMRNEQEALAAAIYEKAVSLDSTAIWALTRLANIQKKNKNYIKAQINYQQALRSRKHDAQLWVALAECYSKQGKYAASIKASNRSLELDPDCLRGRHQLASTYFVVGMIDEAVEILEQLNSANPAFSPGHKLLAECLHRQAKAYVQQGSFILSRQTVDRCVQLVSECIENSDDQLVCLYKLLGDVYTLYSELPPTDIPDALGIGAIDEEKDEYKQKVEDCVYKKLELIGRGDEAFAKAIELSPESAPLWYDRGVNNHRLLGTCQKLPGSLEKQEEFRKISVTCFRRAIELDQKNSRYWNALGIADSRPYARQHCFIRSTQLSRRHSDSWNNMGMFYLNHEKRELARSTFKTSQTLDPTKSQLWFGQGIFNQSMYSYQAYLQARSSFQRALELDPSLASRLGLGYTAYSVAEWQEATFNLTKYIEQDPFNPCAWNLLGLVHETQNRGDEAVKAFMHSWSLLAAVNLNFRRPVEVMQEMVELNLARVLCTKSGRFEEGIMLFERIGKWNTLSWRLVAYAQCQSRRYDQAEKALDEALAVSKTKDDRITTAISKCQLFVTQERYQEALDHVGMWLMENPNNVKLLTVQFALSICLDNIGRAQATLNTLQTIEDQPLKERNGESEVNFTQRRKARKKLMIMTRVLRAHFQLHQGNILTGKAEIHSALSVDPGSDALLNTLGKYIVDFMPDLLGVVAKLPTNINFDLSHPDGDPRNEKIFVDRLELVARAAQELGLRESGNKPPKTSKPKKEKTISPTPTSPRPPGSPGRPPVVPKDPEAARQAFSRLVHQCPADIKNWRLLSQELHAEAVSSQKQGDIEAATKVAESVFGLSAFSLNTINSSSPSEKRTHKLHAGIIGSLVLADLLMLSDQRMHDPENLTKANNIIKEVQQFSEEKEGDLPDLELTGRDPIDLPALEKSHKISKTLSKQNLALVYRAKARLCCCRFLDEKNVTEYYEAAIRADPLNAIMWEELSDIYRHCDMRAAEEHCLRSALKYQGEYKEFLKAAKPANEEEPKILCAEFRLLLRLARFYYFLKRFQTGVRFAKKAANLYPADSPNAKAAHCLCGLFFKKNNQWKFAIEAFGRAIAGASPEPIANFHLAQIGYRADDLTNAEKDLWNEYELGNAESIGPICQQWRKVAHSARNYDSESRAAQKAVFQDPSNKSHWDIIKNKILT